MLQLTSPTSHRLLERLSQSSSLHYQAFPAITYGIRFLDRHMPYLPQRLAALHHWLRESLSNLRYPNNAPFIIILTGLPERIAPLKGSPYFLSTAHLVTPPSTTAFVPPTPGSHFGSRREMPHETSSVGCSSTSGSTLTVASPALAGGNWSSSVSVTPRPNSQGTCGYIMTCVFLSPSGKRLRPAQISKHAARHKIHLSTSTGYMCTSNGTPRNQAHGASQPDGRDNSVLNETVVRVSLGMGSDFEDTWNVLRWAKNLLEEEILEHELVSWRSASASRPHLVSWA